jgi:SAM-dependent methyltransferase
LRGPRLKLRNSKPFRELRSPREAVTELQFASQAIMEQPLDAGISMLSSQGQTFGEPRCVEPAMPQLGFARFGRGQAAPDASAVEAETSHAAERLGRLFASLSLAQMQYRFLCWAFPRDPNRLSGNAYGNRSKLQTLLGPDIFDRVRGKTVIDFGCGYGNQTIELAKQGAKLVVGLDVREDVLREARNKAATMSNVLFLTPDQCPRSFAEVVISLDSFEHFEDPSASLQLISELLSLGGTLLASFGPPWKHPLGGHSFSAFVWSHLLFSEGALCRWYNRTKNTAISHFEEVSGGLNRMTITRFEALVRASQFREASITPVPIRKLKRIHNVFTREFTTSVVKCQLTK